MSAMVSVGAQSGRGENDFYAIGKHIGRKARVQFHIGVDGEISARIDEYSPDGLYPRSGSLSCHDVSTFPLEDIRQELAVNPVVDAYFILDYEVIRKAQPGVDYVSFPGETSGPLYYIGTVSKAIRFTPEKQ